MILYVIAGKAKSGKDTLANIISEYYKDKKILKYSATKYLKDYTKLLTLWDCSEEKKPRDFMQMFGLKIKEKYPDFFIKRIEEDINFLSDFYDIIIVTGVRLVKELEFFQNNFNSVLIKIERKYENGLTEKQKNDITEVDVDNYFKYDYILENNGSIDELKEEFLKVVRR